MSDFEWDFDSEVPMTDERRVSLVDDTDLEILPDQTTDDIDVYRWRENRDSRLFDEIPPHHGT